MRCENGDVHAISGVQLISGSLALPAFLVANAIMVTRVMLLALLVRDQRPIVVIVYPERLVPNGLHEKVAIVVHVIGGKTIGGANQNSCLAHHHVLTHLLP